MSNVLDTIEQVLSNTYKTKRDAKHLQVIKDSTDRLGNQQTVDVFFNEDDALYEIFSNFHRKTVIPRNDIDKDSTSIVNIVNKLIKEDYS